MNYHLIIIVDLISLLIFIKSKILYSYNNLYFSNLNMTLRLASGSYDGTIRFWDPGTGTSISNQTITLSNSLIPNKIEISQSKSKIVVGMNSVVKIYDLIKNTQQKKFDQNIFKGNVTSVGFRSHDKIIYTGCEDGFLKVFDLRGKNPTKQMKQNKPINCAIIHPNQKQILSGDEAGNFRIWDIGTEKQKITIQTQNEAGIRSISISQNGQNIVFADSKGRVQAFGQHMIKYKQFQAHDDYILKCQISPNNKYLATCSADKRIKLYKILSDNNKNELTDYKILKGHFRWVWDCQFSCDSAYLISCSTDATIKLWNVQKGQLVQTLKGHQKGVISLALNDIAETSA